MHDACPCFQRKTKCPLSIAEILDIYGDHASACQGRGDAKAVGDEIVSACSSAILSSVNEKQTFYKKVNHVSKIQSGTEKQANLLYLI